MKRACMIIAVALTALPWRLMIADNPEGAGAIFAADKFYRTFLKVDPSGLPSSEQMKRFAPLFTQELRGMIEDARSHRNKLIHENPAERLPYPGNFFTSLNQGFTFYAVGMPVMMDSVATVPIHLEYHYQGR